MRIDHSTEIAESLEELLRHEEQTLLRLSLESSDFFVDQRGFP